MHRFPSRYPIMAVCLLLGCAHVAADTSILAQQIAIEQEHRLTEAVGDSQSGLVDRLREERRLDEARSEVLHQLAQNEINPELLWRAARSMADTSLGHADEESRGEAALLGLEHARKAADLSPDDPDCQAQLGYLLGITTHLQPMGDRSDHARQTIAVAERTLELRPGDPLALHTLATVNLRLQTLPWIAKRMASDLPPSSMTDAEQFARDAIESEASLANSLLLAKVLIDAEKKDEALDVLREASIRPSAFPRDLIMRVQILELIEEIQ